MTSSVNSSSADAPLSTEPATAAPRQFSALAIRDFRRLWFSTAAFGAGQQMEMLALSWFVLEYTNSPVLVGLVGAARWGGMLFAPLSGVLADRMARRTLLLVVQAVSLATSVIICLLAATDALTTGLLVAVVLVAGLARAFDQTTRQALIGDLMDRDHLTGAVALVQAAMNGSAVLGPVVAGVIFDEAGLAACYLLISSLALAAVLVTIPIRPPAAAPEPRQGSPLRSLLDGAAYVRRTPVVAALLWIAAIVNLCGFPLTFAMMPSFARDVLGLGPTGLGVLLSAFGAGALAGNLLLGSRGALQARGRGVIAGTVAWMAAITLFALSPWFPLSLLLLVLAGVCQAVSLSLVAVLLLASTPPSLRGRVMGVRMFAIATLPLGAALAGWLIALLGAPVTAIIYAAAGAALTAAVALRVPALARQH